jgi:lipoxygenase
MTTKQEEASYHSSKDDDFFMFEASFDLPASFGTVGAIRIDNDHEHEMFIKDVKVFPDGDESKAVIFHCESWVIDNEKNVADDSRVFFPLKVSQQAGY